MPFNEALFWFGITAFGTGLYFLIEATVKRRYSIGVTVIGLLACIYSVYCHYNPEGPSIRLWVILLVLTWAFLCYAIYLSRFQTATTKRSSTPSAPSTNAAEETEIASLRERVLHFETKFNESLEVSGRFKAELDEIYADVILAWLKEACVGDLRFSTTTAATTVELREDQAVAGLEWLRNHGLLEQVPSGGGLRQLV
jgi:hypothetical protein